MPPKLTEPLRSAFNVNSPVSHSSPPDARSRFSWAAGMLAFVVSFAGCTLVGPDFTKPVAPVSPQWQQADGATLTREPAQLIDWWRAFKDPVLDDLIQSAYRNNYNLKAAGLRVLEARAQLGVAVGNLYPQLQQANGSVTWMSASWNAANTAGGDLDYRQYSVGGNVSWELDFWGKFRRAVESADANLAASIAAYDNALVLLMAQVADTYVAIRTAEEQLRVARENMALQRRSVEITEVRYRNGDTDELDLQQARTQLLATEATIPQLQIGLIQARNALATLLGRPPGGMEGVLAGGRAEIPAAPMELATGAPADLLRRRPDVREAELAAEAQNALVGAAEGDLYPSFGIGGFLGVVAADGTNTTRSGQSGAGVLFNANSFAYSLGPYFSWNVLNYGRIKNQVRAQDARLQQALANYQNTVLNAAQEVEDNMAAFLHGREQEEILARNVIAAQRSLALASLRYKEGYSDFQRVLDAQTSLLAAQQRHVSARGGTARSAIGIYRALGGGWQIRVGQDFVDQPTKDQMRRQVDWGDLLQPGAADPPPQDRRGGWAAPDW